ncbi:MAG: DNA recombination protein RmuC [Akkermansiaceae bacterium]|nr:DNA recombination protein RmuC [Akkermansiaceae bacterium]
MPTSTLAAAVGGLGLTLGALIAWLVARSKASAISARLEAEKERAKDLGERLAESSQREDQLEEKLQQLRGEITRTQTQLESELKAAEEKQALLNRAEEKLTDTFRALSSEALKVSSEQFLQLAKTSLSTQTEQAKSELEKRKTAIETLITPVKESLGKFELRIGEIEKLREGAYAELKEQVRALNESQVGLQRETASLVRALRQPTGRGQWGEMQLKRVVELAGMQEHCDFNTQTSTTDDEGKRLRPDLVVHLPGGKSIVVDSKTPMDAYLDAVEATEDDVRKEALVRHARQVRTHIQQLASKNYTAQFEHAPEFTVLFLPSESFFSAALQVDPGLIERGVNEGVILATPTTLIALLRAVAYGWRQEAVAENAREISALGRELHERLGVLADHFTRLGRSLNSAVDNYNKTVGSLEGRVLPSARRFEELKAAPESKKIESIEPIDSNARQLQPTSTPEPEAPESGSHGFEPTEDFGFVPDSAEDSKD